MIGLTEKLQRCKAFMASYHAERGYMPSMEEIATSMGHSSRSSAFRLFNELEERGHIRVFRMRDGKARARAYEILEDKPCPHCGHHRSDPPQAKAA